MNFECFCHFILGNFSDLIERLNTGAFLSSLFPSLKNIDVFENA